VDGHGDALPAGAVARLGTARFRHPGPVRAIAFAPDGKSLFAAGEDTPVRRWAVPDGKLLGQFEGLYGGSIYSMAQSPDGRTLATWGGDQTVRLWDVASGKQVRERRDLSGPVSSLAFSPDGKTLAIGGGHDSTVRLWEIAQGKERRRISDHPSEVKALAFSPDGTVLASVTGAGDASIRLWDVSTGNLSLHLPKAHLDIRAVAFAPDGRAVVSAGDGGDLRLWDVATGRQVRQFKGHQGYTFTVAFSPDGKTLASGGEDRTVRLWEVGTGREVHTLKDHRDTVRTVAFSGDGRALATGGQDRVIRLYETDTGRPLAPAVGHQHVVMGIAWAPGGQVLATASSDQTIRLWEVPAGKEVARLEGHADYVRAVAFAPDGKTLASGGSQGSILVWGVGAGERPREFDRGSGENVSALAFAPDGATLAAGQFVRQRAGDVPDCGVRLFETRSGREVRRFGEKGAATMALAFSPDGRTLAVGDYRENPQPLASSHLDFRVGIALWDPGTGAHVRRLDEGLRSPPPVGFSGDGRTLASVVSRRVIPRDGSSSVAAVWELASGKVRRRFEVPGGSVYSAALSPSGRLLALGVDRGGPAIRLVAVDTGAEVARFDGRQGLVQGLAFSPDGSFLAAKGEDTTVLIWDVRALGQPAGPGPAGPVPFEALWADLGGEDAEKAGQAVWALAGAGDRATAFLRKMVRPVEVDARRVDGLIADLDSARFPVREAASTELANLGDVAAPALRKALTAKPSPEVRQRAEDLLKRVDARTLPPGALRLVRALEALELIGTAEADAVLQAVAKGTDGVRVTEEARSALARRSQRPAAAQ
jgi:WD40 repeat protein